MSFAAAQVLLMEELKTFIIKIDQEKQKLKQIYFTFGFTKLQDKLFRHRFTSSIWHVVQAQTSLPQSVLSGEEHGTDGCIYRLTSKD